jgi:hypothetical protein
MNRDYNDGLQNGHTDGQGGENRLPSRALKRLFQPDQLLPGATNRHDEYRRGYVQGFEDETRLKTAATSLSQQPYHPLNIHTNPETAMSTQDLRHNVPTQVHQSLSRTGGNGGGWREYSTQLDLLYQTKQFLEALQERLHASGAMYQNYTDRLDQEQMMMDPLRRITENMESTRQAISRLIEQIGTQDIPTVMTEIANIENRN